MNMQTLRYPIGEHEPRTEFSSASRSATIDDIAGLPQTLRRAVAGLTNPQLETPFRSGGWTVRQLVHHLADAHMVLSTRVRIALTEDCPPVKTWDEIPWAELRDATAMPIDDSLTIVDAVHARFVYLAKALTPDEFGRTMSHPVWGVIPIDELISRWAWHGKHHTAHITELRRRSGW